jgi:tRNA-dihydrouridine synthase B
MDLSRAIRLGSLELPNRAFLAPLAAVSDVPFRRLCQQFGAGLTFVEMLSAEAILRKSPRTLEMMARHPDEPRLGVQLTGNTPEQVSAAIAMLDAMGFDAIDVNMGCPVRKIVNAGWGSAFLCDPERVTGTMEVARATTSRPLSAKCRIGFTRDRVNVADIAARIAAAGADMVTIHGRARSEDYGTPADRGAIRAGLEAARAATTRPLVTVGNGDVFDPESATRMLAESGADAVMVSRGALGNPWIFRDLLAGRRIPVTVAEWSEVVEAHLAEHEAVYAGKAIAPILARKHLRWYARGFPGAKRLRDAFGYVESFAEARALLREFTATQPGSEMRAELRAGAENDPKHDMDRVLDRGVSPATVA